MLIHLHDRPTTADSGKDLWDNVEFDKNLTSRQHHIQTISRSSRDIRNLPSVDFACGVWISYDIEGDLGGEAVPVGQTKISQIPNGTWDTPMNLARISRIEVSLLTPSKSIYNLISLVRTGPGPTIHLRRDTIERACNLWAASGKTEHTTSVIDPPVSRTLQAQNTYILEKAFVGRRLHDNLDPSVATAYVVFNETLAAHRQGTSSIPPCSLAVDKSADALKRGV